MSHPLDRWLIQAALLPILLSLPVLSAQTSDDSVAELKQQIERLKHDNQQLHQALSGNQALPTPAPTAAPTATTSVTFVRIGETEDEIRAHFKFSPIDIAED